MFDEGKSRETDFNPCVNKLDKSLAGDRVKVVVLICLMLIPAYVFALDVDSMGTSSIAELWWHGLIFGLLFFAVARYRWWLAIPMLPMVVLFTWTYELWRDPSSLDIVVNKKGSLYVLNMFISESLLLVGLLAGAYFGLRELRKSSERA